jgi:hypothetical protein
MTKMKLLEQSRYVKQQFFAALEHSGANGQMIPLATWERRHPAGLRRQDGGGPGF